MNCHNCGEKLSAEDVFCPNCGAKNETERSNPSGISPESASAGENFQAVPSISGEKKPFLGMSTKHQIIAIGCVVVTLILVVVLLCALFSGNSAKDAVKDYYDAIEECDAEDLMETVPKDYLKELMDKNDLSRKELEKEVQKYLNNYYDDYDDIKVSFLSQEKMDRDDFEKYIDLDDDNDALNVKKAVQYELKVRYQSDHGDKVETKTEEFVVFKYKNSWYSMDAMFLVAMATYL